MRRIAPAATLAAALVVAFASAALARDVKRCGITIGAGKTGTLVQDVECGYRCSRDHAVRCPFDDAREDWICPVDRSQGCSAETIVLERNATLDLNGFTLRGAYHQTVLECTPSRQGRCTVQGPGTLHAPKGRPLRSNDQDVVLKNLTVFGPYDAIETAGWLRASGVTFTRCDASFIGGKVRMHDVRFDTGCYLLSRGNLYADGISPASGFVAEGNVRASGVTTSGGGIRGKNVVLEGAQVPSPLPDVLPSYPNVEARRRLVLRNATVGAIAAGVKPVLRDATCLTSLKTGTSDTWGVCDGE